MEAREGTPSRPSELGQWRPSLEFAPDADADSGLLQSCHSASTTDPFCRMTHQQQRYTYPWGWTAQPGAAVPTSKALCYCAGYSTPPSPGSHSPHNTLPHPSTWKCWTESTPWNRLVSEYLCSNFCLCVCVKRLYSIAAKCTCHYPVPSCAVDMTAIEPCKEVESVRDWISEGTYC